MIYEPNADRFVEVGELEPAGLKVFARGDDSRRVGWTIHSSGTLHAALDATPRDLALRVHLAELLDSAVQRSEAVRHADAVLTVHVHPRTIAND
jgi:hypothetical protein